MKGSGGFYVMRTASSTASSTASGGISSSGDKSEVNDGPEPTTSAAPEKGSGGGGENTDGNDKKAGGMAVRDMVGIALGAVSTLFTVSAVIWRWKWLQNLWRRCRKVPEQDEPLVKA